jgi:NDP-sugar pyrophosphorylase family protein
MLNIVIPAAGRGKRFEEAGYKEPKPLIKVDGEPMLERVMENITPIKEHRFIVIGLSEDRLPKTLVPNGHIINLDDVTRGAVETIMAARNYMKSNTPHHSYVENNDKGFVSRIVEKEVISNLAVTGIYYFEHGKDFLKAAYKVINEDIKTNGEFYVSSVIAEMLLTGSLIRPWDAPTAILGTPNELQLFENAIIVAESL